MLSDILGPDHAAFTMLGWWFLPEQITNLVLPQIHSFLRSRGHTPPSRGTYAYAKHWRLLYATVILGYLLYSLWDGIRMTPPNFYEVLGVSKFADEGELKSAFRNFARRNHPDRVGIGGTDVFVMVRDAYESLKHPMKRFAYDRFGPKALRWSAANKSEVLLEGFKNQIGFYIGTWALLVLSSLVMPNGSVSFWRYFLLLLLFMVELQLVLTPHLPQLHLLLLNAFFPNRTNYQHIAFVHQIYIAFATALTRIFPVLFGDDGTSDLNNYKPAIMAIGQLSKMTEEQVSSLFSEQAKILRLNHDDESSGSETRSPPLRESDVAIISKTLEDLLILQALRSNPNVHPTYEAILAGARKKPISSSPPRVVKATKASKDELSN